MAKSSKAIDAAMASLELLRSRPGAPESSDALAEALTDSSNLIVAKAAKLTRDFKLESLAPALAVAFARFMRDPVKADRGCVAKLALAETLYEFGERQADVFLTGARHVQLEGSFGPPTDTAVQLRGVCLLGLIRIGDARQLDVLADQLMDTDPIVRLMAARAAGYAGSGTAALLLRMKILAGDVDPEIVAECFSQIVRLQPARSIEFVARFIDSQDGTIRQSALLAIGASRRPEALQTLVERWESSFGTDARAELVAAIATHRSSEAVRFLIERLEQSGPELSLAILEGLEVFRRDDAIRARVKAVVDARDNAELIAMFARRFA